MGNRRRSGLRIMGSLIGLIKPLAVPMLGAITAGVIGFLLSFGLGTFGAFALVRLFSDGGGLEGIPFGTLSFQGAVILLAVCAGTRGILQYLEQYANHYIAFTILAQLRNKVFQAMRRLAPAKLEQKNQGDLVSMIKGDIELLEVFYAHTISPVCIAAVCGLLLGLFYWQLHPLLTLWALGGYAVIGVLVPNEHEGPLRDGEPRSGSQSHVACAVGVLMHPRHVPGAVHRQNVLVAIIVLRLPGEF